MSEEWEEKKLHVAYDGHAMGPVACEMKRQRAFGFAPRLKAQVRFRLDFSGVSAEVPRPTKTSSFTLSSGASLLGHTDGWRVKEIEPEKDAERERIFLVVEIA